MTMDQTSNNNNNNYNNNNNNGIDKYEKNDDDDDDGDGDDDDDMSSIGDHSPMSEAEIRQTRRVKKAHQRMRQVIILMVAIVYLLFQMEIVHPNSTIDIMTKSIDYSSSSSSKLIAQEEGEGSSDHNNGNNNKQIQRVQHVKHVAAKISKVYKPTSPNVWCIDGRLKYEQGKRRPMGLCYLKIPRAASSYLRGINQRISLNFAKRHTNVIKKPCIRHDGHVQGFFYTKRDPLSYLWTFIRRPSDRSLSRVAHSLSKLSAVSTTTSGGGGGNNDFVEILSNNGLDYNNNNNNQTDATHTAADNNNKTAKMILTAIHGYDDVQFSSVSAGRGGFQLQYAMLHMIEEFSAWNESQPTKILNPQKIQRHVANVLNGYDFIGVVERMDESLVVLKLLLGLEMSDILQFPTKTHYQFQYMKKIRKCRLPIDPNSLRENIPQVQSFLESDEWFAQNYGDYILYHAASTSLDRTILQIGLPTFAKELKEYRALKDMANQICQPKFPCSSDGEDQSYESLGDCYDGDQIGCGFSCLDNLNTTLY